MQIQWRVGPGQGRDGEMGKRVLKAVGSCGAATGAQAHTKQDRRAGMDLRPVQWGPQKASTSAQKQVGHHEANEGPSSGSVARGQATCGKNLQSFCSSVKENLTGVSPNCTMILNVQNFPVMGCVTETM